MSSATVVKPDARQLRKEWVALRLAKEYVVDFDLLNAAARADIEPQRAKTLFKEPIFIKTVQEIIDLIDPDAVATRGEILMALKKEAYNFGPDGSSGSRISALKELARLMGMELPTKQDININAPVINLVLAPARIPSSEPVRVQELAS